jgi:endonuclease/exonuclease/phosphatase family metal-dependent hydrolase
MPERPVETLVGVLPHRAGVEQDEVGVERIGRAAVADGLEDPGGTFRVVLVHLAAEGPHRVGAWAVP